MKKLFVVAVLAVLAIAVGTYAATVASRPNVPQIEVTLAAQDQTPTPSDEDQAAYVEFQKFAEAHKLDGLGRFHTDETTGKISSFDLALATLDEDGQPDEIKWVVYGYPTVKEAAAQIEADFAKFPDGNPDGTTYTAPSSSEKKA